MFCLLGSRVNKIVVFTAFKPIVKMAALAGGGAFFAKKGTVVCRDQEGGRFFPLQAIGGACAVELTCSKLWCCSGLLTPEVCKTNASIIINLLLPLLIFSTVLPAFDSKNMASVLSVVLTSLFYQGVHAPYFACPCEAGCLHTCLICEIGENILEAKSWQPSDGPMLRVYRQVAYANPGIMERWCFGGGFVFTSLVFSLHILSSRVCS